MILLSQKYHELEDKFQFHQASHKSLAFHIIKRLSVKIEFKLKVQKASIQFLIKTEPFGVIGLRRSKKSVFVEFYSKLNIESDRITREVLMPNGLIINRLLVEKNQCYDNELEEWFIKSSQLIAK